VCGFRLGPTLGKGMSGKCVGHILIDIFTSSPRRPNTWRSPRTRRGQLPSSAARSPRTLACLLHCMPPPLFQGEAGPERVASELPGGSAGRAKVHRPRNSCRSTVRDARARGAWLVLRSHTQRSRRGICDEGRERESARARRRHWEESKLLAARESIDRNLKAINAIGALCLTRLSFSLSRLSWLARCRRFARWAW